MEKWGAGVDSVFCPYDAFRNKTYLQQKTLQLTACNAAVWDKPTPQIFDSLQHLVDSLEQDTVIRRFADAVAAMEHQAFCLQHPGKNCLGQTVCYHCNGLYIEDLVFYNKDGRIGGLYSLMSAEYSKLSQLLEKHRKLLESAHKDIEKLKLR